jgi:tryptophan synthase beta chain
MGKKRIVAETGRRAARCRQRDRVRAAWPRMASSTWAPEECVGRRSNVFRMRLLGAKVEGVDSGSCTLKDAINEAMRDWVARPHDTHYLLVQPLGPHPYPLMVREFQSVIGREARKQILDQAGRLPTRRDPPALARPAMRSASSMPHRRS